MLHLSTIKQLMNNQKCLFQQLLQSISIYLLCISSVYSENNALQNLSVEELLNVEVTSVAKKAQSLNDAPAAIFVISHEDIKRIGATSIPEALRLAPGVDVARIDANKWAVSIRGFNGRLANKLLVLIDGRTTYTRAFAGVYWENQDVMLEDVERIEIIRGPGASLWGANAVNGVVNIITKHSADTQGGLLVAGAGNQEQGFGALRYGGKINANTTARAYIKGFNRAENTTQSGIGANDSWGKIQSGFRMDSEFSLRDTVTFQGDAYYNHVNQNTRLPQTSPPYQNNFDEQIETFGGNLLLRQQHTFSSTSEYSLQLFYDFYQRDENYLKDSRHTIDIDFQHRFSFLELNDVIWGLGYRYQHDTIEANAIAQIHPVSRNDQLFSAFLQDEITMVDDYLWLTLGSKIEYNDYSGFEVQPTVRIMWAPHQQHRLWAGFSRAVRTPSRAEHDMDLVIRMSPPLREPVQLPAIQLTINGTRDFSSEDVLNYEIGYRTTIIDNVSIDFTAFYNQYQNLRSAELVSTLNHGTYIELAYTFANNHSAQTYGLEISTVWQMLNWWRWDANYSLLKTDLYGKNVELETAESPEHHVSLRSSMSPLESIDLDILFRYVDSARAVREAMPTIDAYTSLDIRIAWRPVENIELSLVGQNLLASHHLEYVQEAFTPITEINRGMYGQLSWQF